MTFYIGSVDALSSFPTILIDSGEALLAAKVFRFFIVHTAPIGMLTSKNDLFRSIIPSFTVITVIGTLIRCIRWSG